MDAKSKKDILVILINYLIFVVISCVFMGTVRSVIHGEKWLLFSLGVYTMVTGIWGQVLKIVLFRLPGMAFIYEKKIYILVVNCLIILIGLSMILISMLYYK